MKGSEKDYEGGRKVRSERNAEGVREEVMPLVRKGGRRLEEKNFEPEKETAGKQFLTKGSKLFRPVQKAEKGL